MDNLIQKITSRKFIVTVIVIISGLAAAFKTSNNEKLKIAGFIMAGIAAIVYSAVEGSVDKAAVQETAEAVLEGIELSEAKTEEDA